jgi:mannonate dehydratase
MRITNVKALVTCPGRNYVLVKIETDQDGLYGWGDATLNGRELAVLAALEEHIAPLLIGRDPDQIEDIWQYLFQGTYWRGGPVLMTALAGIDLALWDIKGKRAGMPIYSLLGGMTRQGALAYTHCGGADPSQVVENIRAAQERGFKVVRAQVGLPNVKGMTYGQGGASEASLASWFTDENLPPLEIWEPGAYLRAVPALFEQLRQELGDEIEFLHDVHSRLSPIEASRLAKTLEPYHLFFLEDPLRPEHKESFALLRHHSTTPIAMGELFHTRWDALPLMVNQWIDYIRCDLVHIGGITEARKIAAIAEAYQVKTAWHGPGDISPIGHAANVHLDVALTNFGVQEMVFFSEMVQEVIFGGPVYKDGALWVDERPGLGTDVNEQAANRYPYRRAYLPTVRRADGSVQEW